MSATAGPYPDDIDIAVLGSGAAGLTAALTAALDGRSVLLLEHLSVLGGTSARSSGTVWVPGNRVMLASGRADDQAADYLAALVGSRGPETHWRSFLAAAPQMQADLGDRAGIALRPFPSAPDYRHDLPGAAPGWRAMEPLPFDGRRLGAELCHLAPPLPEFMILGGMMVTRSEAAELLRADRSPAAALLGLKLTGRYLSDRMRWPRGTRLVLGSGLVAQLLHAALQAGVLVRREVVTRRIMVDEDRVAGLAIATGTGDRLIGQSSGSDSWTGSASTLEFRRLSV